jgi:hypothetical protein
MLPLFLAAVVARTEMEPMDLTLKLAAVFGSRGHQHPSL